MKATDRSFGSLRQLDHHDEGSVRVYLNQEPDDYPAHWHRTFEFIMPLRERYEVMVDNETHTVLPGEVFMIPSGVVHELFAPPTGSRYILMADQEVVLGIHGMGAMQHMFYPCVHLRGDMDLDLLEEVTGYLWHAVNEREKEDALYRAAVENWIALALIRVCRWLTQRPEEQRGDHRHSMNEVFLDVYAYIAQHCTEKITLEDMAAYAGYSRYHFARMFKEYAGMPFYEYYMRQRMLLCRQLLSEFGLPVTRVALQAGFGSIATFNRVFKQYEGVTPTQYRQLMQGARDQLYAISGHGGNT